MVDHTPENTPNAASVQYKPNFNVLTSDPVILADLEKDPLQHQMKTIGLARGMLDAIKRVLNNGHTLNVPLLMMHGLKDRIVPPEMTRIFFEKVMFDDKKWIGYPEMLHNPQDDIQRDQIFADCIHGLRNTLKTGWVINNEVTIRAAGSVFLVPECDWLKHRRRQARENFNRVVWRILLMSRKSVAPEIELGEFSR
ncbi:serine aminopeptidase domain-containing protein [Bacillus sp. V33-4]|uniref:serine aminopeptidase domain-containing protein n=1 Tax=Bacillus sp. V33-4 TaxID=2054169 RepID=UPI0015E13E1D|nr:alpha/beta hydrolase [Bacillus sp. V33-4]